MDYKTLRKGQPPWIVVRDQVSKSICSHKALCKGPRDRWLLERVNRDIENMGYTAITVKGDNEPAMQQFMSALKDRRAHDTLLEGPPAVDLQSNGVAEKAVQDLVGQARSLKIGLEYRTRANIDPDSPIAEWIPPHAGWLITHERIGPDGMTPVQRLTGRPCRQQLAEFGEQVWAKPLRRTSDKDHVRATLDSRWLEATWVGIHDRTGEHVVIVRKPGQAIKVRNIKLRPGAEWWSRAAIEEKRATPRRPDPLSRRGEHHDREESGVGEVPPADAGQADGGADLPGARVMPDIKARRDFKITRDLVTRLGQTPDCPGCDVALNPHLPRREHTRACRQRLQDLMAQDPVNARRLHSRDVRHGLAPADNGQQDAAADAPEVIPPDDDQQPPRESAERSPAPSYAPTSPAASRAGSAEDRGQDELPRGIGRAREEEEPNARDVRRRHEETRGVRRARDSDDAEEASSSRRRVQAIDKCLMDFIQIHNSFMERHGLKSDHTYTRDVARKMLDELDRRHATRLERFRDRQKNETCNGKHQTGGLSKVYSPARLTEVSAEFGMSPRWALDLNTVDPDDGEPWDFNNPAKRLKAVQLLERDKPDIIMVGPICKPFCSLNLGWNFDRMPVGKASDSVEDGMRHLSFAVHLCLKQVRAGRYFAFEHPVGAASWNTRVMRMLARLQGCRQVEFDFCAYGMKSTDEVGSGLVKKRTRVMTNAERVATELAKAQCKGDHRHVRLLNGRAAACQVYPAAFCRAVCRGMAAQLDEDKKNRNAARRPRAKAAVDGRDTHSQFPKNAKSKEHKTTWEVGECAFSSHASSRVAPAPMKREDSAHVAGDPRARDVAAIRGAVRIEMVPAASPTST